VVVAAGNASRMGQTKQLLPWGRGTLLEHALNTLKEIKGHTIVLVLGSNAEKIKKKINLDAITTITNPNWENGIGSSIACGAKYVMGLNKAYVGILVCLADQPLLTSDYFCELIQEFKEEPNQVIATEYDKGPGVPAIFPAKLFNDLSHLKGDSGAKNILRKKNDKIKLKNAGKLVADIDTADDYNTLLKTTNTIKHEHR
jgi:molybdenum cofactor cytidylyltransferase